MLLLRSVVVLCLFTFARGIPVAGVPGAVAHGDDPVLDKDIIDEINSDKNSLWTAGENEIFKGMSMKEFRSSMLGLRLDRDYSAVPVKVHSSIPLKDLPESFNCYENWPNYMHPIRDQAHCGSCWAFAASEVLSDRFAIASNGTVNKILSPEDLVSCDKGDMGCNGGYLDKAWDYLKTSGIVTESCFPYGAQKGVAPTCRISCVDGEPYKKYRASDYYQLTSEEDIMKEIYLNGPVEAGFRVYTSFMSYKSGVYHHRILDIMEGGHAIKIVGWGIEPAKRFWQKPTKYWICANSWTADWGMNGFFKIRFQDVEMADDLTDCFACSRGKNRFGQSECGIEEEVFAGHPMLD